jgi:hypothetical protein
MKKALELYRRIDRGYIEIDFAGSSYIRHLINKDIDEAFNQISDIPTAIRTIAFESGFEEETNE